MSKNSIISNINADLILLHNHSKTRIVTIDDKVTASGRDLIKTKEEDLMFLHLILWLEYTKLLMDKIELFLNKLHLVPTKKYFSELNEYKRIYGAINENPKKDDKNLLIAAKNLFYNSEKLLQDLESSKKDFAWSFKKSFLTIYLVIAGIVITVFLYSGLPAFLHLDPIGTCVAIIALLYVIYLLLKNYLEV